MQWFNPDSELVVSPSFMGASSVVFGGVMHSAQF